MKDEKRFTRKIHQTGNSLTVGIPAEISEKLNLKKGEELEAIYRQETEEIVYRKKQVSALPEGIDSDFLVVLESVLDDYDQALRNLKDR